jgi:cell division protein FtsB
VSQSLTYKMREAKKVEQDYETAEKDIKELGLKRTTLKTEIADLKKELKKLMEEETEEESEDESEDESSDEETDEE